MYRFVPKFCLTHGSIFNGKEIFKVPKRHLKKDPSNFSLIRYLICQSVYMFYFSSILIFYRALKT